MTTAKQKLSQKKKPIKKPEIEKKENSNSAKNKLKKK